MEFLFLLSLFNIVLFYVRITYEFVVGWTNTLCSAYKFDNECVPTSTLLVVNMESIAVFGPKHGSHVFFPSPKNLFPVNQLSCFPLMSVPTKPPKFVRLKATTTMTSDDQESNRTFTELLPSPWTDQFHSVSVDVSVSRYIYLVVYIEM